MTDLQSCLFWAATEEDAKCITAAWHLLTELITVNKEVRFNLHGIEKVVKVKSCYSSVFDLLTASGFFKQHGVKELKIIECEGYARIPVQDLLNRAEVVTTLWNANPLKPFAIRSVIDDKLRSAVVVSDPYKGIKQRPFGKWAYVDTSARGHIC